MSWVFGHRVSSALLVFVMGCASAPAEPREPEAPIEAAPSTASAEEASANDAPASDAPAEAPEAPEADETTAPSAEPEPLPQAPEPPPEREVRYVVNPEVMRVRTEGVVLRPRAEAVRAGKGHAVRVTVRLRMEADTERSVLAPEGQELAFAGRVVRADGTEEHFADTRTGERAKTLSPSGELVLARTWPDAGDVKPLGPGDELELAVGIWGLGEDADSRRPLRALCKVTAKGKKGGAPRVAVAPPETAAKVPKRRVREE
ncbi:MAG TPA: hypothetical protein VKY73_02315 [Polyangiaceae bacterium]|nr:hypothetical protein [Polyangiaceae bacterium]